MLLPTHIAAGGLAIVLGAVALAVKKGGTIHRRSGLLFVYAMLVMGITAAILGIRSGATGNVFGGLGTVYFVVTALTTVRPASPWTRGINGAGLTVAVGLALLHIVAGVEAFNSPTGWRNGATVPDAFLLRHHHDAGGDRRRAHPSIRPASWPSAPGAPSVANVLRALHRGRIILLDP